MALVKDVIGYLCERYPLKHELSKARLTKLIYLADWKSAIERGRQLTEINWIFNHYGPYVDDVCLAALENPDFNVQQTVNRYGKPKSVISLKRAFRMESLTDEDKRILDYVIETTMPLGWEGFIQLVYSTFPILTHPRMSRLDLVESAKRYREESNAA